ncbi:MAG: tetratricopeptide repeat protein [Candidatus Tectomicrobia bacterium]|nr:tetratricopeptide repeat protein [Candidatus Tectomicrobia bacterium]
MSKRTAHLLLVDASKPSRAATRQAIRALGFRETSEALSCQEALRILEQSSVDVIVADQDLGDKTAPEFFTLLSETEATQHIPFILTGSFQTEEDVLAANSGGIPYCLSKPLIPASIEEMLDRLCANEVKRAQELVAAAEEAKAEASGQGEAGTVSRREQLLTEAGTYVVRVLRVDAEHYEALCALAQVAVLKGRYTYAVSLYHQGINVDRRKPIAHLELAQIHMDREDYAAAIKVLTRFKQIARSPEACQKLGEAYLQAEQYDEAMQVFEEGIQFAELFDTPPKVFAAHYDGLGQVFACLAFSSGDESLQLRAAQSYERSLALDPERISAKYNLMVSYEAMHDQEKAQAVLEDLTQQTPTTAQDWSYLGQALLASGDREKAKEAFDQATTLKPNDLSLQRQIGEANLRAGLYEEAANVWSRSGHLQRAVIAHNHYGLLLRKQKKYQEAMREYTKALDLDPRNVVILCNLARAHIEAQEAAEAVPVLHRALEMDPTNQRVKQLLHFVESSLQRATSQEGSAAMVESEAGQAA